MKKIPIVVHAYSEKQKYFALVDDEDLEKTSGYEWQLVGARYAGAFIADRRRAGRRVVALQQIIMGVDINGGKRRPVYFKNGDTLDCRRDNLTFTCCRRAKFGALKIFGRRSTDLRPKRKRDGKDLPPEYSLRRTAADISH